MTARNFLGAGDLYLARYDDDTATWGPMNGPYEATKVAIKPSADLKESISKNRSAYGSIVESVALNKPAEVSLELAEINRETLAVALFGANTLLNQAAATITDQTITVRKGAYVDLGKLNIASAGFVLKNSAGSVTYVYGTDYDVIWRTGMLRILSGSTIADNASLKWSGSVNAVTGATISGGIKPQVRVAIRLDGKNLADGLPVIVDVWEAVMAPDSEFDFLGSDFGKVVLKGKAKIPVGKSAPFQVTTLDTAV
jgi:hypothetical protein